MMELILNIKHFIISPEDCLFIGYLRINPENISYKIMRFLLFHAFRVSTKFLIYVLSI